MKLKSVAFSLAFASLAASAAVVMLVGCGGGGTSVGGSGTVSSAQYVGTSSPGDLYNITVNGSTLTSVDQTTSTTVVGTLSPTTDGLFDLTVTSSTDPAIAVGTVGFVDYDTDTIVFTFGGTTEPVVMGSAEPSVCPGTDETFDVVAVPPQVEDLTTQPVYGTAAYSATSGNIVFNYQTLTGSVLGSQTITLKCSNGMSSQGGLTFSLGSNSLVVDNGPNKGGAVGIIQPTAAIPISSITSVDYRGVIHRNHKGSQPAYVTPDGSGGLLVGFYSDHKANSEDGDHTHTGDITGITEPIPGIFLGTMVFNDDSISTPVAMVGNTVAGKLVLKGFATSADGNREFLFIQK